MNLISTALSPTYVHFVQALSVFVLNVIRILMSSEWPFALMSAFLMMTAPSKSPSRNPATGEAVVREEQPSGSSQNRTDVKITSAGSPQVPQTRLIEINQPGN